MRNKKSCDLLKYFSVLVFFLLVFYSVFDIEHRRIEIFIGTLFFNILLISILESICDTIPSITIMIIIILLSIMILRVFDYL
jgi:hypothetical protein